MSAFRCPSVPIPAIETGISTCAKLLDPESLAFIGKDSMTTPVTRRRFLTLPLLLLARESVAVDMSGAGPPQAANWAPSGGVGVVLSGVP